MLLLEIVLINQHMSAAQYDVKDSLNMQIENSSHYRKGRFHNSVPWQKPPARKFMAHLWSTLFDSTQRKPASPLPVQPADLSKFHAESPGSLHVTWLGHSSLLLNLEGVRLILDPVFTNRATLLGPRRFNGDTPVDPRVIESVDAVLISHNHYDHLNRQSIQVLAPKTERFLVPLGVGATLERWGVPRVKITELDWWNSAPVFKGIQVTSTPAQHFSSRSLTDRNATLWTSWVISGQKYRVFYSGDSGYFSGFREIGERYGPFDITFLESAAYNELWRPVHMFPEEVAQAHLDLQGRLLHPIHWGTYSLAAHSWYEPMQRLARAADSLEIQLVLPVCGETSSLPGPFPVERWWEPLVP